MRTIRSIIVAAALAGIASLGLAQSVRQHVEVDLSGTPEVTAQEGVLLWNLDYLLAAPGYRLSPGNRFAGVPDSLLFTWDRNRHLYKDFEATNADGTVNAVIEIPAGTNAKWETSTDTGRVFWELKNGKPRMISYLGYPGDYGMIPRTVAGDGDPLDVLCIGRMELRGAVVQAKVIGVFHMIDGGDVDDKLIAVIPGTPLAKANSLKELDTLFPGVTAIISTWFTNYKGPGADVKSGGLGDVDEARKVLDTAIELYKKVTPSVTPSDPE